MVVVVGWILLLPALAAIGYTLVAIIAVRRFAHGTLPSQVAAEPVTLLKPLHGAEPSLAQNLLTFLEQDWPAAIQMIAGTNRDDDDALPIARALPGDITICDRALPIGSNAKITNLTNMMPAASHDLLVLSDSDMAAPRDYLAQVAAALAQPGVGAVTCAYRGRADATGTGAGWSRFAAAGISWQFAPSVVASWAFGLEQACMGSTIAMRRATLDRIGGFRAFADVLADDHAIGAAVRDLGLRVVPVPALVLAHGCVEQSVGAVWRHERRWAATVRGVSLAAHVGSLLTHPLALALAAAALMPRTGLVAVVMALIARSALVRTVDHWVGESTAPIWWLPARDVFSFAVYVASFFATSVDWRGASLVLAAHGRITTAPEHP